MSAIYFDARISGTQLQADINKINRQLSGMSKDFTKTGKKVDSTFSKMSSGFKNLMPVATFATASLMLKKMGQDAYKFSTDFSKAMREVQTISQAVQNDFGGISKAILDMAANGPHDAIRLAEAYYQIVSAGYDGAKGLELLRVASESATAGITETKTAADGLTTILNAWGKDASEAGKVADVMFKTVEKGKTTFGELASGIAQVAPMASAMNISFEEVSAAIASLTKQGNSTSMAITQIRQAIISANEVLGDGWSKSMSFQEGLQAIRDMAGGSDTKLQEMMGRVEGMNAVLALTGDNAKEAAKDLDAMTVATGSMKKAYNEMMLEADNQWSVVHNKWQRELKKIGDLLQTGSIDLAKSLNELLTDRDADIIKPEVSNAINNFATEIDGLGTREEKLKAITERIIELKNASIKLGDEENKLKKQQPGGLQRGLEAFNRGIGLGTMFSPGLVKQKELAIIKDDISINNGVQKELAKLYNEVLANKDSEVDVSGGKASATKEAKTLKTALENIKKYKEKLGTGSIEQDVTLYLKIANEQEFIDKTGREIRERLQEALNAIEMKPISSKSTKGLISTKEIKGQLKPMKQLTAEEEKRLKIQAKQLDEIDFQKEAYQDLADGLSGAADIVDALSYAVGTLDDELGRALGSFADIINSSGNLAASLASGNIAGAVSSGIGILGGFLSLLVGGFNDIKETTEDLKDVLYLIESIEKAKSKMTSKEWTKYTEFQMKELEKKISNSMQKYDPYGIAGLYDTTKISIVIDYFKKISDMQGGLTESQQEMLDNFIEWYSEYNDLLNETNQRLTGATKDGIADSIVEGFRNGYSSAEDFAKNFEELMKTAILNALKVKIIEGSLDQWYADFAEASKDGLTEDEMKILGKSWDVMIARQKVLYDNMEKVTGMDFDYDLADTPKGLTGAIKGITEESAGIIAGQMYASREVQQKTYMTGLEQLDAINQSVTHLATIADNTSHNKRLKQVEEGINETNRILKDRL